jgi:hypothetical protein
MTPTEDYDPKIHITAGELREKREVLIDKSIPDFAWVRRTAVSSPEPGPLFKNNRGEYLLVTVVRIMEPFQWVTL